MPVVLFAMPGLEWPRRLSPQSALEVRLPGMRGGAVYAAAPGPPRSSRMIAVTDATHSLQIATAGVGPQTMVATSE